MHPAIDPLARNLVRLRGQRSLSLSALAQRAGVAKSTLSELERGRGNPSIDTLWSLARALNVPFASLFEDGRRERPTVIRLNEAPVIAAEGNGFVTRHLLNRSGTGEVEMYILQLEPGFRRDAAPHGPGVIEHVVVMAGTADVGFADESHVLGPGDCISFPADRPHHYAALRGRVRLLALHDYQ
jgi:XRE family transcriptional regulator, regulator of sulfur utilization